MRVPLPPPEEVNGQEIPAIAADLPLQVRVENWRLLREAGVPHPDYFAGGFFGKEALTLERLLWILEELPAGVTEMMTHPGLADEQLLRESFYAMERERELELLCHPLVREKVSELGIELVDFSVLAR
jgi:predicted glycoside hydrolase/deacetylase ChbG (UPF0249 family)